MVQLQIYFKVAEERAKEFEQMYALSYVPALGVQEGYLYSTLLRVFKDEQAAKIEAAPTEFNYQMELAFHTEESRLKWVASPEHQSVWPVAAALASEVAWRGYDVVESAES
jgi:hypothetical protein